MSDEETTTKASTQRRVRPGRNTCGPSSLQKRLNRQLAGIMAHLEQHPTDNLSRARVSRISEILRGRD